VVLDVWWAFIMAVVHIIIGGLVLLLSTLKLRWVGWRCCC
jgi:hypothetical protein